MYCKYFAMNIFEYLVQSNGKILTYMTGIGLSYAVLNSSEYESLPQGEASNASVHEPSSDSSGK